MIDISHRTENKALNKCLDQITDAFRQERKECESVLLRGHRVMTMVQDGRHSFVKALHLMNLHAGDVRAAYEWLDADDDALNAKYNSEAHSRSDQDLMMLVWFDDEEAKLNDNLVDFLAEQMKRGAA